MMGIGTTNPQARLDLGNGGNALISTYPPDDVTPDLVSYNLSARTAGGGTNNWSIFTAPVGGGYGVPVNSLSIWQYTSSASPACCMNRFTILPATTGQSGAPVVVDGNGGLTINCRICIGWADGNGASPTRETCVAMTTNSDSPHLQLGGDVDSNDRLWLFYRCP